MSQELVSQNDKLAVRKPRLYIFLVTSGFVLLGGAIGILVGAFLFDYFIPFWHRTEINVEGHNFSEIVIVEYTIIENSGWVEDNVILRTDRDEYFAYHQNKWQQIRFPELDLTKFPHNYRACDEWDDPPPATYVWKTKDSSGISFMHAIGINSRCYILFPDGSLELWIRDYSALHLIYIGFWSLFLGMLIGGIFGKRRANKKVYASFLS